MLSVFMAALLICPGGSATRMVRQAEVRPLRSGRLSVPFQPLCHRQHLPHNRFSDRQ